jgi:predicted nucleotidyltransferase component of viral defense system
MELSIRNGGLLKTSKFPHDDKASFVEAVRFTAGATQFSEALVEKDYFCSLILAEIFSSGSHKLVFKGGTLLNKTHAGFYRLSEDLDFSIDVAANASRVKPVKEHLAKVAKKLSFRFSKKLVGKNESSQYQGEIEYESLLLGNAGTIKVDVGLRENVLEMQTLRAKTLLQDPFSQEVVFQDFEIKGLSRNEAYSEKIRAALSREFPAIRDIFDLDYALKTKLFDPEEIAPLVRHKFEIQNCKANLSAERKAGFASQIETNLRPVLRRTDFENFDFESAWNKVCSFERFLSKA